MGGAASSFDKDQVQGVPIPESAKDGFSAIYRSAKEPDELCINLYPDVNTIYEIFQRGVKDNGDGHCLGHREYLDDGSRGDYVWETYNEVNKRVGDFASGLVSLGLTKGDHLGIYSINRPEWVIAEQACYHQSAVVISLYDTLGPDAVEYIIQQAEISAIVCSRDRIERLLEVAEKCPTLKIIIQIEGEGDKDTIAVAKEKGISLYSFTEIEKKGAFDRAEPNPPAPEDIASLMYTSGTTGLPKGVILTHRNIVSTCAGIVRHGVEFNKDDVHISYLPMAHIFERAVQGALLIQGGAVGFYQGNIMKLFDDIAALQPTLFASVPRLFNRLYDKINNTLEATGGVKKMLFDWGFSSKLKSVEAGKAPVDGLWDRVVFNKMRAKLGGRVRMIITGAAPISPDVYHFLEVCFCVPVIQGYGLTETCAGAAATSMGDSTTGHVGPPVCCVELRLADVPEMNYFVTDDPPRGEVCMRGPNVTSGYYKQEEKTAEVFDDDGFFYSGDIGQINPNGTFSIIDRKKNIFKLAQGEYVAAEYLERVYTGTNLIQQIFVYGDSLQSCLVAVAVPDPEAAAAAGFAGSDDLAALCANEDFKKAVHDAMNEVGKENKLKGFEFVKAITLESEPFSVENDLLTPTFKPKRPQLKAYYQTQIDEMYASLEKK